MRTSTRLLAAAILAATLPATSTAAPPKHYGNPFGFFAGLSESELVGHISGFSCASSGKEERVCSQTIRDDQWPPIVGMGWEVCAPGAEAIVYLKSDRIYAATCHVTEQTWRRILNTSLETRGQPKISTVPFLSVVTTVLEWSSGKTFYALFKTTGIDVHGRQVYLLKLRVGATPAVISPNVTVRIDPMPL